MLYIVMGMPGSGKTTVARYLEEKLPALRINTDEINDMLFPSGERTETGDFTPEQIKEIYAALRPIAHYLAKIAPDKDFIIEGSFRKAAQRDNLIEEMEKIKYPYQLLLVEADEKVVKANIQRRFDSGEAKDTVEEYDQMKDKFERPTNAEVIDNAGTLEELYKKLDKYISN